MTNNLDNLVDYLDKSDVIWPANKGTILVQLKFKAVL